MCSRDILPILVTALLYTAPALAQKPSTSRQQDENTNRDKKSWSDGRSDTQSTDRQSQLFLNSGATRSKNDSSTVQSGAAPSVSSLDPPADCVEPVVTPFSINIHGSHIECAAFTAALNVSIIGQTADAKTSSGLSPATLEPPPPPRRS